MICQLAGLEVCNKYSQNHPEEGMFEMEDKSPSNELVEMTADIVSAYVSNNSVVPSELSNLIDQTFIALRQAATKESQPHQDTYIL